MLARACYPARICQHERLAAMRAHVDAMEQQSPAAEPSTRISTSNSRSDNLLTLTPQPR